ncbi:glycoside hydrolase family 2 protein [Hymenobacter norwichensis]|uniref:glycoside hydrolase family 2 protein n=1 Tax=Hymenobacter norwichensis TaxID=223903 RepID=UPI0003B51A76|nr:glycoside hydrolase family 2 TIM barrel-domain containing protein [Hymenobacter norwichensis]
MPKRLLLALLALLPLPLSLHAQQTETQFLSGTDKDHTKKWKFYCTAGRNSGKWTTIPVPSNWELQGFGKYNYGHDKDPDRGKEKGLYKYEFKVPKTWDGKTINLVFDGSMSDTEVKINGQSAGPMHQGSYYRFKYDITKLLKPGKTNLLEATVSKHSANESVNDAERRGDFWLFGGIFRPVFLEALPATHINRVAVDAKADGSFKADVYTQGNAADEVVGQLYTLDGQKAGAEFRAAVAAGGAATRLQTTLSQAKLWTPESPNLYRVAFTLRKGGQPVHTVDKRIGFRTVELRERDGIYVNGAKVKFKGVNRHSFWPTSGRTTSKALSILDVNLMKDMNMNAVRMSHYPPDDHFLAACDSLGLMVLDEVAGWHANYDTPTGTKLTEEMVVKDETHPSIVVWVNGNEGGHNFDLDPVLDRMDLQKRPVIHAWQVFRGTDTQHYINYDYGNGTHLQGHNVVFPTEFLHGLYDGGHGAGLEDYWEQMWAHPRSAGGFLWDFSDAGVVRTDKGGILDTDGNHGADGILGPYREKEGSYFTIKEVWSPVFFERREITPAFDGSFRVQNRFHYTNLNQCKFTWKLAQLPGPGSKAAPVTKTGTVTAPSVTPNGTYGTLKLDLPTDWQQHDVLYITAQDPAGREIYTWSWPIARPEAVAKQLIRVDGPSAARLTETDSLYTVSANGVELTFGRKSGVLRSVRNAKGVIPLTNGPVLAEGETMFEGLTQRQDGQNVVIEAKFAKKSRYQSLQWTVYPSGWVRMSAKYFPKDYDFALAGLSFTYPEKEVRGAQWRGDGPYRVWKDRIKGTNLGVWTKGYNDTSTGEMEGTRGPEYPEFKGYYSNFYWLTLQTTGQPFTVVCDQEDVYLRLFTPRFSATPYNTAPAFPSGSISFMHGITPIGTKSQKAENMGPMGKTNMYYDYSKDPSYAKEITLYFDFTGQQATPAAVGKR